MENEYQVQSRNISTYQLIEHIAIQKNRDLKDFETFLITFQDCFLDSLKDFEMLKDEQWTELKTQFKIPIGIINALQDEIELFISLKKIFNNPQDSILDNNNQEQQKDNANNSGKTVIIYYQNKEQKLFIHDGCKSSDIVENIHNLLDIALTAKLTFLDINGSNIILCSSMPENMKIHVSLFIPPYTQTIIDTELYKWQQCKNGKIENSLKESKFIFDRKISRICSDDFSWTQTTIIPIQGITVFNIMISQLMCCCFIGLVQRGIEIIPYDREPRAGAKMFEISQFVQSNYDYDSDQSDYDSDDENAKEMKIIINMNLRSVEIQVGQISKIQYDVPDNVRLVFTDTKHGTDISIIKD